MRFEDIGSTKLEPGAGIEPAMAWCKHATLTWLGYPGIRFPFYYHKLT